MVNLQRILFISALSFVYLPVHAAQPLSMDSLFKMNLDELLQIRMAISSNTEKPLREQTSAVTLITQQEVIRSGARDLLTLLKMVPGVTVVVDLLGVRSVAFRGISGFEGKVLLLLDGIAVNDLSTGTLALGHRIPASMIHHVEVIRGSGSVQYGGQAELMVIKVVTADSPGALVQLGNEYAKENGLGKRISVLLSGDSNNGVKYRASIFSAREDLSGGEYQSLNGRLLDMSENTQVRPLMANAVLSYRDWQLQILHDHYEFEDQLVFGGIGELLGDHINANNAYTVLVGPGDLLFQSSAIKLDYAWAKWRGLKLKSSITLIDQINWQVQRPNRVDMSEYTAQRRQLDSSALYEFSESENVLVGISFFNDKNKLVSLTALNVSALPKDERRGDVNDFSIYGQYETSLTGLNITLGGRYEDHELVGDALLPRLTVAKAWGSWHSKFIYSKAFKIPQYDVLASSVTAGTPIEEVERETSFELELGYQVNSDILLQSNVFWQEVTDIILYEPVPSDANINAGDVSTFGIELMMISRFEWGNVDVNYSRFEVDENNVLPIEVAGRPNQLLGIANDKIVANVILDLPNHASLSIRSVAIGERYACTQDVNFICGEPTRLNEEVDVSVYYRQSMTDWFYALGVANVLDDSIVYAQAYRGSMAPVPGLSRRFQLDVGWEF
ncbi:hypothetical protein A9Q81_10565 [Gammaproteobacteria bacterium 42_54_T18]|nr:hypothetical protein A9Q81_10565 [Gammaproteobacteria bacterium 42_54_T18]